MTPPDPAFGGQADPSLGAFAAKSDDFPESQWSLSVQRVMTLPRPKWRGISHRVAFPISVIATIYFVATRPTVGSAVVAFIFGFGSSFMLGVSALVHLKRWKPRQYQWLFKLDHTGIFMTISCTTTPIAVYALDPRQRNIMLGIMWTGVFLGIVAEWLPGNPPKGMVNAVFICLGWIPILMGAWLWDGLGPSGMAWLLGGGAFYTLGAFVVGSMWPNPNPDVFGYHEIWHLFVVFGITLHWVLAFKLVP